MLLADLMNGIIYQISNLVITEARILGLLATLLPGVLFLLGAAAYLIAAMFSDTLWSNYDSTEKAKLLFIGFSSLFGLTMYFFADNYYIFEEIRQDQLLTNFNNTMMQMDAFNSINSIQPTFLVLAIIFFRAVPYAIELLSKECNVENSLEDDTTKSIYSGILNVVVVTIEFDSWFTIIQTVGDCSIQSNAQLVSAWILWSVMIIIYSTLMAVSGILGYYNDKNKNGNNDEKDLCFGIVIMVALVVGFGLYLLSDNAQPIDCYISFRNRSIMKLSFLLFSLAEYIAFLLIVIWCTIRRN